MIEVFNTALGNFKLHSVMLITVFVRVLSICDAILFRLDLALSSLKRSLFSRVHTLRSYEATTSKGVKKGPRC